MVPGLNLFHTVRFCRRMSLLRIKLKLFKLIGFMLTCFGSKTDGEDCLSGPEP